MRVRFEAVENGEWEQVATEMIKAHMKRARVNYVQLAEILKRFGHDEDNRNLSARVKRGRFSAAFMLQCLSALGVDTLHVPKESSGSDVGANGDR